MASLKEIKSRIASVSSTLKITSAMKMVASAKLHKAQLAIGNMLPYESALNRILMDSMDACASTNSATALLTEARPVKKVAIVAFSSNSSLCGAFNSNVIREASAIIREYQAAGLPDCDITVYSVGRKMAEAMKKLGFASPADFTKMADSPNYADASTLAQELLDGFIGGSFDKVELVYNHYKSTSSQPTTRQTHLPLGLGLDDMEGSRTSRFRGEEDLIIEPSAEELIGELLPKLVRLRIYTTLLDSNAAEYAARTVAMQTATDNGDNLLQSLTLEYNKGRQQKITSEILDIVGGSLE